MLTKPELMSVALIQQLYGTPQRSTDGDEQLKYSFLPKQKCIEINVEQCGNKKKITLTPVLISRVA